MGGGWGWKGGGRGGGGGFGEVLAPRYTFSAPPNSRGPRLLSSYRLDVVPEGQKDWITQFLLDIVFGQDIQEASTPHEGYGMTTVNGAERLL